MSNVRDFGAIGDGKADDTEAIQHAIDEGVGLVEFPRGDYRLTSTLTIDLARVGRTGLDGAGGAAKLIMAGPGPAVFLKGTHAKTAEPGGFRPSEWQNERMPIVSNIEIEGRHPEADGLKIVGVMQPTLSGVLVREVRTAVHLTSRARNLVIDGCHFYNNTGVGVHLDSVNLHQSIIADSHISYCRLGGIRIENSEIRNLQITGNDIEYNNNRAHGVKGADGEPTAEIYIDVGAGSVREGTIASNTIQATASPNGSNIRMIGTGEHEGEAVNHRAGMWTISGNLIGSQRTNVHLTSVRGVVISGNYIYSGHHRNLLVESSRNIVVGPNCFGHNPDYRKRELATGIRFVDCQSCNLTGLLIEDAAAGKHTVTDAEPIQREALLEIIRCRRMNLSGLQILDGTPRGLLLEDCHDTVITGCTIIDNREPRLMQTALVWRGGGSGSLVSGSRIGRGTQGDLEVPEDVTVTGVVRDGEPK
ncbi:MAG: hypothetical protein CMJ65_07590 [Planctomycetaceae bacterium]|jgi:hypothetical protein|nr:hypothetical protein [Planctomycetaceae bacterium]MDP7277745.1 right-handed parallel beta-helix repeat-containing protein [Planctomycetaceae bacterium]